MSEIYQFGIRILLLLIDLMTLALIVGIFYTIGLAIVMMARNQSAKWANIAYILIVMGAGIALLRWYPQQVISSIRVALSEARPEADLLRNELYLWLPELPAGPEGGDFAQVTATPLPLVVVPEPTATPLPSPWPTLAIPPGDTAPEATPERVVVVVTATPLPPEPTPEPTACLIHHDNGATWPCPPTPEVHRP